MELILKSESKGKIAQILALANKLGISVEQKEGGVDKKAKSAPPQGRTVSIDALLEDFGKATDFPTTDEIRSKAWPASW